MFDISLSTDHLAMAVARRPEGSSGCPLEKYCQFYNLANQYVFVQLTMGRHKEIDE